MTVSTVKSLIGFTLVLCTQAISHADQRLWVEAEVNGDPARFIFDTGADRLLLFNRGADRLGLARTKPQPDPLAPVGAVPLGAAEPCILQLWRVALRVSLPVMEMPDYLNLNADGVIGWGPVSENIVRIDATALKAYFLETVPQEARAWTRLPVQTDSRFLFLRIPHPDKTEGRILVDTGFVGGVALHPQKWREWAAAHGNQPTTLDSYFMPGAGLSVKKEVWARELDFGPLRLTETPVEEANPAQVALGSSGYEASLGLAALKRLDLIVDGKGGWAYLRLKDGAIPVYEHNRLGAVFVPSAQDSDDLVATVVDTSPAHDAGIRNGDVLLKIDDMDVTKWRTAPDVLPLSRFWAQPAGTHLGLTLKRGATEMPATVTLRDILSPGNPADSPPVKANPS